MDWTGKDHLSTKALFPWEELLSWKGIFPIRNYCALSQVTAVLLSGLFFLKKKKHTPYFWKPTYWLHTLGLTETHTTQDSYLSNYFNLGSERGGGCEQAGPCHTHCPFPFLPFLNRDKSETRAENVCGATSNQGFRCHSNRNTSSAQLTDGQWATGSICSNKHWHQHRWRVGRRLALKHNLTFPSHLVLHCYSSHRKISREKWIALGNLLKNQLLTLQCSFRFLLNQSATLLTTFSCTKGNAVGFNDRGFIFITGRFSQEH